MSDWDMLDEKAEWVSDAPQITIDLMPTWESWRDVFSSDYLMFCSCTSP